jgi:Lrp/AsnC family transcriptional regulator, leucine-responsive regulatory protein
MKEIKKESNITTLSYERTYAFDAYDKKILQALDKNGRATLADLTKPVGLSRDAIRHRIEKMIERKVILSFKPLLNPPVMGYPIINYVFISLYNPSQEQEKLFISYLKGNKHVTYVAGLIGKWDFIIDIMAENQGHFDKILKEIRQRFPELIKDYEIYGVLNEYKYEEIARLVYE